jgi:chromosomal replication initiation ATPase DnaA
MKPPDLRKLSWDEKTKLFISFGKGCGKTHLQNLIIEESFKAYMENREPRDIDIKMVSVKVG